MTISEQVTTLVEGLELTGEGLVLAEVAQNLAKTLDDVDTAAYSRPNIARELRVTLARLVEVAPVQIRPVSDAELAAVLGAWEQDA